MPAVADLRRSLLKMLLVHFLLVYDIEQQRLIKKARFESGDEAAAA